MTEKAVIVNSHELVEKHFRETRGKVLKHLTFRMGSPEAAEDVLQEAYFRALKYFESFNGNDFDKWLNKIIGVCAIDFFNADRGYSKEEFDEEHVEPINCPSYPNHVMKEIFEIIDTKSEIQMEVLNLYFRCEYGAKDIHEITGYSYAQCHKIISRFREELRSLYKE